MPEPQAHPYYDDIRRVAVRALFAGIGIMLLKLGIFYLTNSVAVLTDALESVINIAAAAVMLYSIWYSNRPADRTHPYGHGKIEFMAVGLEGWLILLAGVTIAWEAISRWIQGTEPEYLSAGIFLLGVVAVLDGLLAYYVYNAGRRFDNDTLRADGKHLITDVASTVGVIAGLLLIRWTGKAWLDPLVAIVMAGLILTTSWKLLWQSFHGLMDHSDPEDEKLIGGILSEELTKGTIRGYHKVRHRHTGSFHWVDMHLQVDENLSIAQGHELASRIEHRIETALGQANATAHLEPYEAQCDDKPPTDQAMDTGQPTPPTKPAVEPMPESIPLVGDEEEHAPQAEEPVEKPSEGEADKDADSDTPPAPRLL